MTILLLQVLVEHKDIKLIPADITIAAFNDLHIAFNKLLIFK